MEHVYSVDWNEALSEVLAAITTMFTVIMAFLTQRRVKRNHEESMYEYEHNLYVSGGPRRDDGEHTDPGTPTGNR